jgi:hypothetical protein
MSGNYNTEIHARLVSTGGVFALVGVARQAVARTENPSEAGLILAGAVDRRFDRNPGSQLECVTVRSHGGPESPSV